jgi:uncharacterized membrane protein YdjX (TVP38/TMEM64 family)
MVEGHAAELEQPEPRRRSALWRPLLVLLAVAAVVLLGRQLGAHLEDFAGWVDGLGFWGPAAFMTGYALATLAFVPGSILTLAAGAIFGIAWGSLYVFLAASVGACGAFLIARYLARGAIERKLAGNAKFGAIDGAVARDGRKIVTLLRLSPVFPFNLLNYGLGLTQVRFADYAVACFGMLPGTLLYVYTGSLAGSLATAVAGTGGAPSSLGRWALAIVGLVATAAVTITVTRSARRALREVTEAGGDHA